MREFSYHEAMDLYVLAKPYAKTNFCLSILPPREKLLSFLKGKVRQKLHYPIVLYQHIKLMISLIKTAKQYDFILVRDFLTIPLACCVWMIFPLRKKVCFIIAHNFQKALVSKVQRRGFVLMYKMGIRFCFLESTIGVENLGVSVHADQMLALPHTILPITGRKEPSIGQRKCVGMVGRYRPEKGMDTLISFLLSLQKETDIDVVIGTPDYAALKSRLAETTIEIVDTTSGEDYAGVLLRCDVVLFNYERENYFYRGSGVIANAIECGANVVCPNYPVFSEQILKPVPVGYLFEDETKIVETVLAALSDREKLKANIEIYNSQRGPVAIARYIDEFAIINGLIKVA